VDAPVVGSAPICSAWIVVVAIDRIGSQAFAAITVVSGGAGIAIVAFPVRWRMDASTFGIARVGGAGIPIVTGDGRLARRTFPHLANITHRTDIVIGTGIAFVGGNNLALAIVGITNRLLTDVTRLRNRANDHGFLVYNTLIWKCALVTEESSVADVTVIESVAIFVYLAGTIDGITNAIPLLAGISHRAWVFVVTCCTVEFGLASTKTIAGIVGARVIVVADDRLSNADSAITMIANRAGITVNALPFTQLNVGTPGIAVAGIARAVVVVIA